MDLNINKYIELCENEPTIPIFSHYKWLNSVCGKGNWDVILVQNKNNDIIGALPFYINRTKGFKRFTLPKLTQKLGPWIKYPEGQKYDVKISYEHKVLKELIVKLPKFDHFFHKIDYNYNNILSFYWAGFDLTIFYTYQLNNLKDLDEVFKNFRSNIRTDIKKAKRNKIEIIESTDLQKFYEVNRKTFERQNIEIPYSLKFIESLDYAIKDNRKIYFAIDKNDKIHAVAYIVWDNCAAYYLMGGGDPELRNSGATSLLMWNAIQEMATKVDVFDFEGSMIQPVERFFRGFGAKQIPYYGVSRVDSKILKSYFFIKNLIS